MDTNALCMHLGIETDLVMSFFIVFSRFEYALKRVPTYSNKTEKVSVNWDKFTKKIESEFRHDQTPQLKSACDYLLNKPPKIQINTKSGLGWKEDKLTGKPKLLRLIVFIRRVRNNLFHGGKFPEGPIEDPGRDEKLLKYCMIILEECLKLDDEVKEHFYNFSML